MKPNDPDFKWKVEHGTKVIHRTWIGARIHALTLNYYSRLGNKQHIVKDGAHMGNGKNRVVYTCFWSQDYHSGRTATKHYHVGRPPGG